LKLDAATFGSWRPRFEACGAALYRIADGGGALAPREVRARLSVENDVEIDLVYPPPRRSPLRFDAVHLRRIPDPTYGAELTVTGDGTFLGQALLRADQSTLDISDPFGAPSRADGKSSTITSVPAPTPSFRQYLTLGIEHILTGYDHLLFLAGLLVACRSLRTVLRIVTCFTIAHSITLALAALNVVALSSRVVEPLIAATIVFVGVENLLRGDEPTGRWALTFTFGLIHGFGFASVLREIGLGAAGAPLVAPLFAFNLGVELGQVAVAAAILPVLWALRRVPAFARHGRPLISIVVAGIGVYWLVQRLAS
jgi:hydrogenase/urease accessory protein HupE